MKSYFDVMVMTILFSKRNLRDGATTPCHPISTGLNRIKFSLRLLLLFSLSLKLHACMCYIHVLYNLLKSYNRKSVNILILVIGTKSLQRLRKLFHWWLVHQEFSNRISSLFQWNSYKNEKESSNTSVWKSRLFRN